MRRLPIARRLAEAGYLTNETVFYLTALPPSALVIGGGPLGCELAQAFCCFGSHIVIVHGEPHFLPIEERDAAQMVSDTADASARIVVQNALFLGRKRLSALTIPWCTYTDPEIAHLGIYVRQARERGIPVKTFTVLMHEVDRAIARVTHTYPTQAEAIKMAANAYTRTRLSPFLGWLLRKWVNR